MNPKGISISEKGIYDSSSHLRDVTRQIAAKRTTIIDEMIIDNKIKGNCISSKKCSRTLMSIKNKDTVRIKL